MSFKEWLLQLEVGTDTGSVAVFSRMTLPLIRRQPLIGWEEEDPFFKKRKKKERED